MQKNILIIGYGDIAKRLIKVLGTKFISIYAISRNDSNDHNINKINWDWLSDKMVDLNVKNFDSVIIIPKPSSLDEKGYKEGFVLATQNILNLLSGVNINKVIAVSSTRVYGSSHKGLVDESSIEILNQTFVDHTNNDGIILFASHYNPAVNNMEILEFS